MARLTRVATTSFRALAIGLLSLPLGGGATAAQTPGDTPAGRVCVLRDFGARTDDPVWPRWIGLVVQAKAPNGDLYSTSPTGGKDKSRQGTIFKISPATRQLEVLYSFDGGIQGAQPGGGLIDGKNEYLYGTTSRAGVLNPKDRLLTRRGSGTVFRFKPGETEPELLHTFRNGDMTGISPEVCPDKQPCQFSPQQKLNAAGAYPISAPVLATDGQFYGVAPYSNNQRYGVLYKVEPYKNRKTGITESGITALCIAGNVPPDPKTTDAQLRDTCMFNGPNGNYPVSLTAGDGVLYGTTLGGTANNPYGTVFKAELSGRIETLHRFDLANGSKPYSVIVGQDGKKLYGSTLEGGGIRNPGYGVVYELTLTVPGQPTTRDRFTVLYRFTGGGDGSQPMSGLVERQAADGKKTYLYGSTRGGGHLRGVLYRVSTSKDFQVLYKFPFEWGIAGRTPETTMLQVNGDFYGMTAEGGSYDGGVFFRLDGVDLPPIRTKEELRFTDGKLGDPPRVVTLKDQPPDVKIDPSQPVGIEVRTGASARPSCSDDACTPRFEDLIQIKVSNCRNAHIIQFISREKERGGSLIRGTLKIQQYRCENGVLIPREDGYKTQYLLTTNPNPTYRIWHLDVTGYRSAYYDENPGGLVLRDATSLSVFDQPNFVDRGVYDPANSTETWRAIFKDYVMCNDQVIGEVQWARVSLVKEGRRVERYDDDAIKIVVPPSDLVPYDQLKQGGLFTVP